MFYIQVGVSLQRQQSSRSPGCIRLLDSSVSAGVSSERDGQRDRQETGTMGEREKEAARERKGQERRGELSEKRKNEMKGGKLKRSRSFHTGLKGTFCFVFCFFPLLQFFSLHTRSLSEECPLCQHIRAHLVTFNYYHPLLRPWVLPQATYSGGKYI